jgi:predicted ATP-grasp superfamily ATP-dependent carboligase
MTLIHALARRGVPLRVLAFPRQRWVARSRMAEGHVLGRLPDAREQWLSTLERLARLGEGVLISGSDRATEFLVAERERIPAALRSFESPRSAHLKLMDKGSLYELAERVGVRTPWTLRLPSATELERVIEEASYPCVVKPALSHVWRRLFGEHRVLLARDRDELARLAAPGLEAGLELLVSEYVPGPEANLENAVILRRSDGSQAISFGIRKLRQYPPGFGAGSLHVTADLPETMALGTALLDAAGFAGLATVEAKRHADTGELVLVEVNAKVTQPFGLGDAAGVESSWRLYATLAGLPLSPQRRPRLGVRNVVPTLEPRAAWVYLAGGGSVRSLLASYRGVRDMSGIGLHDPVPAALVLWSQLRLALSFLRRRGQVEELEPS